MTLGDSLILNENLLTALESCNRRLKAIAKFEEARKG